MRVPLSWLRDFAPIEGGVEDLADVFSNLGLVVDGVEPVGGDLDGIVVARVLALRSHPDADKIQLVDVDPGDGGPQQIACGAFNMAVGDLVALATVGTVMPGGMEIGRRKLRGQWSNGMLCSPAELDLPGEGGEKGILVLPPDVAAPGTALAVALGLEADVVFDLDISPNRPDAMSIAGVARDVGAAMGVPFRLPEAAPAGVAERLAPTTVSVRDPELCPRFTATVMGGVVVGPSPRWLARRLTLCGMRPINNVVDVSNYVMLELGQPNHAYDLDRLPGGGLIVRRAKPGETLVTLDGIERRLEADDCLICDALDTPVGIAGIMGGVSSEISDTTTTLVLEAAYFTPMAIARTGKRLGLFTEARSRFERGCDPQMIDLAIDRFASLLAGVTRGAPVDVSSQTHLRGPRPVQVRASRVNQLLGTSLTEGEIIRLLGSIGFSAAPAPDRLGTLTVIIPTWRPDSEREIDVIEEVARLHGYRNISRTLPPGVRTGGGLTPYQRQRRTVRDILAGAGVSEAWTTTFLAPGDLERAGLPGEAVELENPLDRSESLLRTSLVPGLLKAVRFNADRQMPDVSLFEVGHVFAPPEPEAAVPLPDEREDLAVVVAGQGADALIATRLWAVLSEGLRLSGVMIEPATVAGFHPTRGARIVDSTTGEVLGAVGEVDPTVVAGYGLSGRVGLFTVNLGRVIAATRRSSQVRAVSRFPASDIDLAFVVGGSVAAGAVAATIGTAGGAVVEHVVLFDIYLDPQLGPGRRSLAYHVRLRTLDHTLTDAEVSAVRQRVIDAVVATHGAVLRG